MKKLLLVVSLVSGVWAGVIPNNLQWPIKGKTVVDTSIFFNTEDAVESKKSDRYCGSDRTHFAKHVGHDIIAQPGTAVYPIYDGVVSKVGKVVNGGGWGAHIVIEHDNNKWTSVYWHLEDKGLPKVGQRVTKNTILGYIRDTSNMNDVSHLHIGIRPKPYDSKSVRGFGTCTNLLDFVNPMKYLPHRPYSLIDDTKTVYKDSSWHNSNKLDMYSGVGYLESAKYGKGTIAFYNASISFSANYKVYAKFPVSSYRSPRVLYLLAINDKVTNYKIVNQSDFNKRGHNVFLFNLNFKKNDKIVIIIYNLDKTGKKASSDALLFVRQ